jgi:hypothetical protein
MCTACFVVVQARTDTPSFVGGVDLALGKQRNDFATLPTEIVATRSGC